MRKYFNIFSLTVVSSIRINSETHVFLSDNLSSAEDLSQKCAGDLNLLNFDSTKSDKSSVLQHCTCNDHKLYHDTYCAQKDSAACKALEELYVQNSCKKSSGPILFTEVMDANETISKANEAKSCEEFLKIVKDSGLEMNISVVDTLGGIAPNKCSCKERMSQKIQFNCKDTPDTNTTETQQNSETKTSDNTKAVSDTDEGDEEVSTETVSECTMLNEKYFSTCQSVTSSKGALIFTEDHHA